jgi:glycosyltransferase involved in cell wall biosynthesis
VQEIYPDILIESGMVKSQSIIYFLKWIEKIVYNQSDAVTTIDQLFYDKIVKRFKNRNNLHIIPNFVDTDIYKPLANGLINLDEEYFPKSESLKLMYAGNIGHAQDWEPLIQLVLELKNEPVEFFVIGDGALKEDLRLEIVSKKLEKLHLIPYQPRDLMPALIAYSDLQFIFMAPKTEEHGFPSKVYTIMACAKPLLVCSGEKTPIVNFLKDKDCAYIITEKAVEKKVHVMASIIRNLTRNVLSIKGQNGHGYIASHYSKSIVTKKYVDMIDKLLI